MYVINLGAVVSSKLGETSKNLSKIFKRASAENCILFLDEFDSLGKLRDYSQDHGEMKRVVNTILQLFDYLPQNTILIAATNQIEMIDEALLRRFEYHLKLDLPDKNQIKEIINLTLLKTPFSGIAENELEEISEISKGLSYFIIQKTLITAIKRTLFSKDKQLNDTLSVDTTIWKKLIKKEL
jgi:AAA+ superfamily predicted ATPase